MSKKFDDFLKIKNSTPAADPIDWKKRHEEWIKSLEEFYEFVESALKPYKNRQQISILYEDKLMHEEGIGSYRARTALIKVGQFTVRLDPIGTMLFGAKGRIDLVGPGGTARFVLVDKDSNGPKITISSWDPGQTPHPNLPAKKTVNWTWKITTLPPQVNYFALTPDSFKDALMEVLNG